MLILGFILFNGALLVGSQSEAPNGSPENVTIQVIDSKTVQVFWTTSWKNVERYDVTYNPAEDRIVTQAAGNSHSVILRELRPNTQYQITVTAVINGKNYRSRRLVFKTANDSTEASDIQTVKGPHPTKSPGPRSTTPEVVNPDPTAIGSKYTPQTSTTVRGVEIGLVLLALVVWIIAVALFFHRWGKIRMLLPYQPDYKTQQSLKVPGTGTTMNSGRSGNGGTQAHQDGPGCIQHMRWSTRYFEDRATANKVTPSRWASRPRVSSAIFPASTSFFARTSIECESPRLARHSTHSRNGFPTETIPLCQVTQPRSESPAAVAPMNIPAISSSVNEKMQIGRKKCDERKVSSDSKTYYKSNIEKVLKFEEIDFYKNNSKLVDDEFSRRNILGVNSFCQDRKSKENLVQECQEQSQSGPLYFAEFGRHSSEYLNREPSEPHERPAVQRYSRSSLKKQKMRFYGDPEPVKNVPTSEQFECTDKKCRESDSGSGRNRRAKELKTVEMRRKTFLRKISLQDTYLNYNQDYWLDFRKSGRFHKSIDLGYLGNEETVHEVKKLTDRQVQTMNWPSIYEPPVHEPALPGPRTCEGLRQPDDALTRCGSDPLIFSGNGAKRTESEEILAEVLARSRMKNVVTKRSSWFLLPKNDNIPLFSDRNGLIETDFEILSLVSTDEHRLPSAEKEVVTVTECSDSDGKPFDTPFDFSNFYEIQLNGNGDTESKGFDHLE